MRRALVSLLLLGTVIVAIPSPAGADRGPTVHTTYARAYSWNMGSCWALDVTVSSCAVTQHADASGALSYDHHLARESSPVPAAAQGWASGGSGSFVAVDYFARRARSILVEAVIDVSGASASVPAGASASAFLDLFVDVNGTTVRESYQHLLTADGAPASAGAQRVVARATLAVARLDSVEILVGLYGNTSLPQGVTGTATHHGAAKVVQISVTELR